MADWRTAPLRPELRATLGFLEKLTLRPDELTPVVADAGIAASTVVIGHSMGGLVTLRLATLAGAHIAGAVAIDSPVRDIAPEDRAARQHRAFGPLRVYPTPEAAVARFRPIPTSRCWPISRTTWPRPRSARPKAAGRGSSTRGSSPGTTLTPELLTRLDCRVALFRAEHGLVTPQQGEVMYDRLGRVAPVVEIPVAGHHIMLDQPIALVAALRTLLAGLGPLAAGEATGPRRQEPGPFRAQDGAARVRR